MSDELEMRKGQQDEAQDEVEGHTGHHGPKFAANAEAGDEASGGDEVEAHGHHGPKFAANAEAGDEADDGDEVEAHRSHKMA